MIIMVNNDNNGDNNGYLVGGWPTHLEKYEFVNGKDDIPYMKWKIKIVWNHQPDDSLMIIL
jgi:hypothetical protein